MKKTASFLEEDIRDHQTKETSGVAVLFSTEETLLAKLQISTSINTSITTLEAGGDHYRPHRRNGVAIAVSH